MTNEQLAALDAAATQGVWEADGSHWKDGMPANWVNDRDFTLTLVNAYRAGHLVVRTEPSEADVERVAQNLQDHMEQNYGIGLNASQWDAAAIAAMVR